MRIKTLKLHNFRGYTEETAIDFGDLTAFVGKNDIGKSSILEALDIFFNQGKGTVKLDKDDINRSALERGDREITISICFEDLPNSVIIDATNETSLQEEHLLNADGQLEIVKKYPNAGNEKVFIRAYHPTNPNCADLLQKKESELRRIIDTQGIECVDRTRNAVMRASIWNHYSNDLQLGVVDIDISKSDAKAIWDKLQTYLPMYTLFQADRKNSDGDSEIQDPLKEAVKEILADNTLARLLDQVTSEVDRKLQEVSDRTLAKLREMDADIANSLSPTLPTATQLKWSDVFKNVSITGDGNIPINKRGSGVRRLILLNFFRAEAERRLLERSATSIIYAIEEPETSQHSENQRKLIKALIELSRAANTQVLITTHSATIVKELHFGDVRLITTNGSTLDVLSVSPNQLPYPSLNEVNYLAFSEITEEYHNELFGHIEEHAEMNNFKSGKPTMCYRKHWHGREIEEQLTLSEYIRHQIHHPENRLNTRYTREQLHESIELMRDFISTM